MIDCSTFEYKESRWADIFAHLKGKGFDVYSPGVKAGECTKSYVVVTFDGSTKLPNASTDEDRYEIMCYVPKMAYSTLEPMIQSVKKAMKELEPMIMPYGQQTASFYEEETKSHMVSITYRNNKKML